MRQVYLGITSFPKNERQASDWFYKNLTQITYFNFTEVLVKSDLNIFNNVEDNDKSLVHFTKINNLSFLFTGDISSEVEENIIRNYDLIETDILKLANHGSKTSSSKNFIKQLNPKLSIISSGMNNLYRHPSKEVLDLLENEGVFYLDTKYEGDITIYFTKFFNFFYTSDGRIGII